MTQTDTPAMRLARELLEASENATPGEWWARRERWPSSPAWVVEAELSCINGVRAWFPVTTLFLDDAAENMSGGAFRPEDDAAFIALTRTHAPEIARALLAAEKVVEAAEAYRAAEQDETPRMWKGKRLCDLSDELDDTLAAYRAGEE